MKKPSRKISAINVVPYLDVMLVLLVIFMITAPLLTLGELKLPRLSGSGQQAAPFQIFYEYGGDAEVCGAPDAAGDITCRSGGDIELKKDPGGKSPMQSRDDLIQDLRAACIVWNPADPAEEFHVTIAADERVFYGEVLDLMNEIREKVECDPTFSLTVIP